MTTNQPGGTPAPADTSGARPSTSAPHRLRFLLTPRWIVLAASVVVFTLACYFLLAPWQFARSSQHDEQQQEISAAIAAGPAPVSELLRFDGQPATESVWREVVATGQFDADSQAYVRLRQNSAGQPAYEVVVGFVTDTGERFLVDRGYIPFATVQAGTAAPATPSGTVTITGRVQQDQTDPRRRPPSSVPDGTTAYNAVSSGILTGSDRQSGSEGTTPADAPTYRGFVQLGADSPGVLDPIGLPVDNSRPFYSYAIQWLSFGAIAILGFCYFVYREMVDPTGDQIYLATDRHSPDESPTPGPQTPAEDAVANSSKDLDKVSSPDAAQRPSQQHQPRRRGRFDKSQLYDS